MHPRISIRGCVHRFVHLSVGNAFVLNDAKVAKMVKYVWESLGNSFKCKSGQLWVNLGTSEDTSIGQLSALFFSMVKIVFFYLSLFRHETVQKTSMSWLFVNFK